MGDTSRILIFFYLFFGSFRRLDAVNHWIVTQSGKIQAFLESPFDLRKPDDLLALLEQEKRRNQLNDLYEDLIARNTALETKWVAIEKNSNVASRVTTEDVDCLAADQSLSELDLYNNIASNGTQRKINITIPKKIRKDNDKEVTAPVCINFSDSLHSESLVNKTNIVIKPEEALRQTFLPVKSLDHFGNYIVMSLIENSTSWVHYNLASFYWRIKGEGDKAIDCLKLAIQFVTGNFQDIPLHNLAGILHQSRHSKEAIQILNSAIQFAPEEPIHYFAMANIYATIGDFNKSVMYYEKVLEIEPSNKNAANHRHAVLCYVKLETALTTYQEDLQNVLTEMHDYHSAQLQWLRLQERLMWERASFDYHYDPAHTDMLDTPKKFQRCLKKTTGGKPVISCDFYDKTPDIENLNLQNLFQIVENEKQKLSLSHPMYLKPDEFVSDNSKNKNDGPKMAFPKFSTSMSTIGNQYFDITGWPKKEQCLDWNLPIEERDDLDLPVYLPPDNKGYQLKASLTDYLNLPFGSQHDLPWYPPICDGEKINGEKFIPANEKGLLETELTYSEYLKRELLKYVNDGNADEHEIGQRIITAIEKKTAPRWVLATLASLYWRVRGNIKRTLDCLDMAFQMAPKDHSDVILVSLGSTFYQLGLREQALKYANLAFKINYVEPSTNFLLASLHYENNNPLLAMYYLKNALRVDPGFYDGLAEKLLKIWSCRIKLGAGPKLNKPGADSKLPICPYSQPVNGESLFCDDDDIDCKKSNFQCFKTEKHIVFDPANSERAHEVCKEKISKNLGQQIISSLLAAENSDLDGDQSEVQMVKSPNDGYYYPHVHHHVHMGLSLGAEHPLKEYARVGDFYVSLDINENPDNEQRLHIYDKYGTYTLSPTVCQYVNLNTPFKYTQLWNSIKYNTLDIAPFVKYPINKQPKNSKPYCTQVMDAYMPYGLNELTMKVLGLKLLSAHDKELTELLQLISGNQKLTVKELGIKISKALMEDEMNWELLTASAVYWTIYGNTEQAIVCIRGAITKVPHSQLDVPLTFLSHLLGNLGLHKESLDIANLALSVNSNTVWNHFRVADIYIKVNGFEQAVPFLRASLQIDDKFDSARIRLKAVLCKLLFEDGYNHGSITAKIVDN